MWSSLVNGLMFAIAVLLGAACVRLFRDKPVSSPPDQLAPAEIALAGTCVVLNSLVMWFGWLAFRAGVLVVLADASALRVVGDALWLLLVMDFAMYLTHRLAHHPLAFRYVHGVHHRYERVRPLTLFALHPLEVLGFGGLWISVLLIHDCSLGGLLLYLSLNTAFGVVGHTGVEPVPSWLRALPIIDRIGSSTFHARHHLAPRTNFGFYTNVWDRLFGTLEAPGHGDARRAKSSRP